MTPAAPYTFVANVDGGGRTLHNDDQTKVVQFTFAPAGGLAAHSAPFPASIYIVRGEGELQLGEDKHQVSAGAFAHMPPNLEHAIRARTELVMLLIMNKAARQ